MVKKIAVVLIGLVLMGCSSVETEPFGPTGPSPDTVSGREAFHQVIDENAPSLQSVDDSALESFAVGMCDAFDSGATLEQVIMIGLDNGLSSNQVGTVVGASIAWKCPEYEILLDNASTL